MRADGPVAEALDRIIASHDIGCVFQPIVDLVSGVTVGFEALARALPGAPWVEPDALFAHAAETGVLPELDWICRAAACRAALAGGLPADLPLFINTEPASARTACPADLVDVIVTALGRFQIVAEVTERSIVADPAGLLAAVTELRALGHRIALDDVGADRSSQVMMSLLRPDVIKLDRRIIQGPATPAVAAVVNAVLAEAEHTGAVILAEGIETAGHANTARAFGASLAQGWLYGRPAPLPDRFPANPIILPRDTAAVNDAATPFDVARAHRPAGQATKRSLFALSRHLEDTGVTATEPTVLLATFQHARYFDDRTRDRYSRLAGSSIFTAVYAAGMATEPAADVRGCPLDGDDPLTAEWNVIVIGSHFAGGLFARELPFDGDDADRPFELIISYDRAIVLAAARPLIQRIRPRRGIRPGDR